MSTKPNGLTMDDITKEDRAILVDALTLKENSLHRAAKATKNEKIFVAIGEEVLAVQSLIGRFR